MVKVVCAVTVQVLPSLSPATQVKVTEPSAVRLAVAGWMKRAVAVLTVITTSSWAVQLLLSVTVRV